MNEKAKASRPGIVKKVIAPLVPDEPEKAEISIPSADDLYREIRIENTWTDEKGNEVSLKDRADVEVTVEADAGAIEPKGTPMPRRPEKEEGEDGWVCLQMAAASREPSASNCQKIQPMSKQPLSDDATDLVC